MCIFKRSGKSFAVSDGEALKRCINDVVSTLSGKQILNIETRTYLMKILHSKSWVDNDLLEHIKCFFVLFMKFKYELPYGSQS